MSETDRGPLAQRLLHAAVAVFGERGYHAARVSDIVGRAGVAQGTFYLYFANKEAIFLQIVDDFFGRLLGETLGRYPACALQTPHELADQLARMWRTILERCRAEPVLTALVLRESAALGSSARPHVNARFAQVVGAISDYLREAQARGLVDLAKPDLAAWVVLGMIERAIHYAVVIDPAGDLDPLVDALVRQELGGLRGASA